MLIIITWIKVLLIIIFLQGFLIYKFTNNLNNNRSTNSQNSIQNNDSRLTLKRLNQAMQLLKKSEQSNDDLRQVIDNFLCEDANEHESAQIFNNTLENHLKIIDQNVISINVPSIEYEQLRRRLRLNTQEMWNYFSSELGKIQILAKGQVDILRSITSVLEQGVEHKRSLISDIDNMQLVDGYEKWRQQEAEDLSDLVQARLTYLQNPRNCEGAKKLICKLDNRCGYGGQLHHIVDCFIVAYATERTMILKSRGWRYNKSAWNEIFKPISQRCFKVDGARPRVSMWPGHLDSPVIFMPTMDCLRPRPPYLPLAIPDDLAPRLMRLHGDPIVWWVGQFLKYLLKPKQQTQEMINAKLEKLGFKKPIVGIHVRRTDKLRFEAAFHGIKEYMPYAEDYFLTLEVNTSRKIERRVFIASDDPEVIHEARKIYSEYDIIGDPDIARLADVSTRYSGSSLNGIILDIHLLSMCDYVVCTFSSNVCRVAYEMMNTFSPDASSRFKSLDNIYYYRNQNGHNRTAVIKHEKKNDNELDMNVGDIISIAGNHWDGFSKGTNTRTNQVGLLPSFKVNNEIEIASFPIYPNVQIRGREKYFLNN